MNVYAVSRRSAAAILAISALTLGACADADDAAVDDTTTVTETTTSETSESPSPTSRTSETSETSTTSATTEETSPSEGGAGATDAGAVTEIDAEGIFFMLDDVEMTCWVGQQAFLNCEGTAEWTPTAGNGPANTLSFDMNTEAIQAGQANANLVDLDIEEVDEGGRYEVKGVIFDLTEPDRMTFTDGLSGKSGYITAERYGWS